VLRTSSNENHLAEYLAAKLRIVASFYSGEVSHLHVDYV